MFYFVISTRLKKTEKSSICHYIFYRNKIWEIFLYANKGSEKKRSMEIICGLYCMEIVREYRLPHLDNHINLNEELNGGRLVQITFYSVFCVCFFLFFFFSIS